MGDFSGANPATQIEHHSSEAVRHSAGVRSDFVNVSTPSAHKSTNGGSCIRDNQSQDVETFKGRGSEMRPM